MRELWREEEHEMRAAQNRRKERRVKKKTWLCELRTDLRFSITTFRMEIMMQEKEERKRLSCEKMMHE